VEEMNGEYRITGFDTFASGYLLASALARGGAHLYDSGHESVVATSGMQSSGAPGRLQRPGSSQTWQLLSVRARDILPLVLAADLRTLVPPAFGSSPRSEIVALGYLLAVY
jgi:hypothetical protein